MSTIKLEFKVDDIVYDDLTNQMVKVLGVEYRDGVRSKRHRRVSCHCVSYWVDSKYLGGGRHPWELTKLK